MSQILIDSGWKNSQSHESKGNYVIDSRRDEKQKEVICLDKGYHLVLAPAGCGKTDILAERVHRAVCNGVKVEDMLCLTFTNRASRGMQSRIKSIIGDNANKLFIGNLHRFCAKFIFDNNIVSQSSAIMDEEDELFVINNVSDYVIERIEEGNNIIENTKDKEKKNIASLSFEERKRFNAVIQIQHLMMQYRWGHPKSAIIFQESDFEDDDNSIRFYSPDMFSTLCKEAGISVSIESLLSIYDNSENHLYSDNFSYEMRNLLILLDAAKKYESYKKDENIIDFDDLLLYTYEYTRKHSDDIHKYHWIQIDEVQDLNVLQFAIIDAFTDSDNVTIYLGDEQQAIFSFIGARLNTLRWLKERCNGHLHHLNKCYRSPKYLLDVFNDYAHTELGTDSEFLPKPNNFDEPEEEDLIVYRAQSNDTAYEKAVELAQSYPDGRTAILVATNNQADTISHYCRHIPHFKISGTDLFSLKQTKLLLSHLNIVNSEINFLAWARILSTLKLFPNYASARQFVSDLKVIGINPSDLLLYQNSSYLLEFLKYYRSHPIVIFDTETTGLNVFDNDIVQIAATKYIDGNMNSQLNILLHTNQKIPQMLGNIVNPLIEEYAHKPHLDRTEGLKSFVDFAQGCVLIGHNVQYDYNILINNCKRDLPNVDILTHFPIVFDTLKLTRLICPSLKSYKLKDLLVTFNLTGKNSHLADEDIKATYSLAEYCFNKALALKDKITLALTNNSAVAELFQQKYGQLYKDAKRSLYVRLSESESATVKEFRRAYEFFLNKRFIENLDKFNYICAFLEESKIIDKSAEPSLYEQLNNHIVDLNTLKEADICDSSIIKENIFISTVHKAKGLEFDNVIVYGCVNDIYPFYSSRDDHEACKEDARKLYVAISRAKKRLCLLTFDKKNVYSKRWEKYYTFNTSDSPFISGILSRHPFKTLQEEEEKI